MSDSLCMAGEQCMLLLQNEDISDEMCKFKSNGLYFLLKSYV